MRYSVIGATVEQVRQVGGINIRETRFGITFATLTEAQAERLRAAGAKVNLLRRVSAAVRPPPPVAAAPTYTPAQLIVIAGYEELRAISEPPLYGEGFNLALVDTGIRESHEKLAGRVVYRRNFTADPMRDGFDHGTGVASVALAVAPRCNLLNIKVLGNNGEATEEEVILGIDHLIDLHDSGSEFAPHVINLSLGGPDTGDPDDPLRLASRAAIERGIWVFAAAGNAGPDPETVMSPACEQYVAAVGSAKYLPDESAFAVSEFSSRGPTMEGLVKPDAVLFGENVDLASSASDTATAAKSGTSFATPFASAMALLYHEGVLAYGGVRFPEGPPPGIYPELTELISVRQMLDRYLPGFSIKPQGAPVGKDNAYGHGLPFGPLIMQSITRAPAIDISALMMPVLLVGMMSVMMKAVK